MALRSKTRRALKWAALTGSILIPCLIVGSYWSVLNVEIHASNSYELGVGAGRLYVARLHPTFIRPARPSGWGIRRGEDHYDYRPWQARFFVDVPLWPAWVLLVPITVIMFRRDRPPPVHLCSNCGYNLTGNVTGRCPECGEIVSSKSITRNGDRCVEPDHRGSVRHDRWVWVAIVVPVAIVALLFLASLLLRQWHLSYVVNVVETHGQPAVNGIYAYRKATGEWPEDVYELVPEYIDELTGHHVFDFWESDSGPLLSIKVGMESYVYYTFDPQSEDFGWTYGDVRLDVPAPATNRRITQPPVDQGVRIEALIEHLAISDEPATTLPVYTPSRDTPRTDKRVVAYEAAEELKSFGKAAFPCLLKHLDDRRQSVAFRRVLPSTVGDACFCIIQEQVVPLPDDYPGSFYRTGANGDYCERPVFFRPGPFDENTIRSWLEERNLKSLVEMQVEGLEWLIAEEKRIGFRSDQDREAYLTPLERQLEELKSRLLEAPDVRP